MSVKYLGQPFEIHTGGVDHIGVHHANEIAQSEAAAGKPLAKYWMHCDFLLENGKKMAKSAGHFLRLQDIIEKGYSALDFRYLCLAAHYRSKLDFSWESLEAAHQSLKKLKLAAQNSRHSGLPQRHSGLDPESIEKFDKALSDDLNSPEALSVVMRGLSPKGTVPGVEFFEYIDEVLGLKLFEREEIPRKVQELVDRREQMRKIGNYKEADELRDKISDLGYEVEDTQNGPRISNK
jgi:cysteinyl-tRNA synthetase